MDPEYPNEMVIVRWYLQSHTGLVMEILDSEML